MTTQTPPNPKLRPWCPDDGATIVWWVDGDRLRSAHTTGGVIRLGPYAHPVSRGEAIPVTDLWVHAAGRAGSDMALAVSIYRYAVLSAWDDGMPTEEAVAALRGVQQAERWVWGSEGTPGRPIEHVILDLIDRARTAGRR